MNRPGKIEIVDLTISQALRDTSRDTTRSKVCQQLIEQKRHMPCAECICKGIELLWDAGLPKSLILKIQA